MATLAKGRDLQKTLRMKRGLLLLLLILVAVAALSCFEGASKLSRQGADANLDAEEDIEKPPSPVQAMGIITEGFRYFPAGSMAFLILSSTLREPHQYITTAHDVYVEVPGGERIELTQRTLGHYWMNSEEDVRMVYQPGGKYLFRFQLDDEEFAGPDHAGGLFVAEVRAPNSRPQILEATEIPSEPGQPVTISWSPAFPSGIYTVTWEFFGGPILTAHNQPWSSGPDFTSWKDDLLPLQPNSYTIGGKGFLNDGLYSIQYAGCSLETEPSVHLSADLGSHSGFMACSSIDVRIDVP